MGCSKCRGRWVDSVIAVGKREGGGVWERWLGRSFNCTREGKWGVGWGGSLIAVVGGRGLSRVRRGAVTGAGRKGRKGPI